jgi:hypothetical protein
MVRAPDGSSATYDESRTRAAYNDPTMGDYCECPGCRNYRAAWKPEHFDPELVAACNSIGINAAKAFETVEVGPKESGVSQAYRIVSVVVHTGWTWNCRICQRISRNQLRARTALGLTRTESLLAMSRGLPRRRRSLETHVFVPYSR